MPRKGAKQKRASAPPKKSAPEKQRAANKGPSKKAAAKKASPSASQRGWRAPLLRAVRIALYVFYAAFIASIVLVGLLRFVNPPGTPLMVVRQWQSEEPGYRIDRRWRSLQQLGPNIALAAIAAEDQKFPTHWGFDFVQLEAAIDDYRAGKGLRGASTISQQVAKNVFLTPSRSFVRKGIEAYFTVLIEALWPKARILEIYLNIAETGDGLFGVEAAAHHYFQKPARELSREEAALLAAILPNPRERDPASPSPYLEERQRWILGQMRNLGGASYLAAIEDFEAAAATE